MTALPVQNKFGCAICSRFPQEFKSAATIGNTRCPRVSIICSYIAQLQPWILAMTRDTLIKCIAAICLLAAIVCVLFGAYDVVVDSIGLGKDAAILFPAALLLMGIYAVLRK